MKYYKIRINSELVGRRQVLPIWEYDIEASNAESKLKHTRLPDFEPVFSKLYIDKVTDVIDNASAIGGTGFIVNEKLKNIFKKFKLDVHRIYDLDLYIENTKERIDENFYWLQIVSTNFEEWIDFKKSKFYLFDDFEEEKVKDLSLKKPSKLIEEIKNTLNTDNIVIYSQLVLNHNFKNYDFFYLDDLYENTFNYPIVSEKLKKEIEKNDIIAFEFKKINIELNE